MTVLDKSRNQGFATASSPLFDDLLRQDSRTVPDGILAKGDHEPPVVPIPITRYFDPEFAKLEMEHIWKKRWQFAALEQDMPEIGDRVPYDVGTMSFFIVRSAADEFRAFYNSCLHRGTKLCTAATSGDTIRCPFHAWQWKLDGTVHNIPSRWDFSQVTDQEYHLPEVRLARWGGFIFINPDPDAGDLSTALGVIPNHFAGAKSERRITIAHARKKIRANWKLVVEAFLEAYHVVETHSQAMSFTGDANTQYEVWDDGASHVSRLVTPSAVPSPHLGESISARDAATDALQVFAMAMPPEFQPDPATFETLGRREVAEWRRQTMGPALGQDFSGTSDAEMLDSIQYFMFPNFGPWLGEGLPLIYQFMPYGDDPNESVMITRMTIPGPAEGPLPPSAPVIELGFDDPYALAPQFGMLSQVFDQDMANLPNIQLGLKAASPDRPYITLGRYQEVRIQQFHNAISQALGV